MEIPIIFEDEYLIVINKPAGVVVNKSETAKNSTIQEWAETRLKISKFIPKSDTEHEFYNRGGVVHRLDKETSGVLLIAKSPDIFENLKSQFKSRRVAKTYIALAHGKIIDKESEINVPIGRLPWNRTRFGVLAEGRDATTLYKVIEYLKFDNEKKTEILSLLTIKPKTGRTHQIRVHLRHIGHPIFSDILYAGRKNSKNDRKFLNRHFLHASHLSIYHPKSNEPISFESKMPSDLNDLLKNMEKLSE